MKRIFILLALFTLAAILVPAPASAGVLRALGHTAKSVVTGTGHFAKSLGHDVARDFYQWIY
jgi:hypothetical protein